MSPRSLTASAEPYSPQRRTALVLVGTGTAGAYHAGVLRALHEAGVKLDVLAARGVGVVGALFAAVDGAQRLWDDKGFWRSPAVRAFYAWRPTLRLLGWAVVGAAAIVAGAPGGVVGRVGGFLGDFLLLVVGPGGARGVCWWVGAGARARCGPHASPYSS